MPKSAGASLTTARASCALNEPRRKEVTASKKGLLPIDLPKGLRPGVAND